MSPTAPIIVLGAGHNGLTAAAALAARGRAVLVLERRATTGGIAATETLVPGFRFNSGFANAAAVRPEIVRALGLQSRGLEWIRPQTALAVLGPAGPMAFDRAGRIRFGAAGLANPDEAERFAALVARLNDYGAILSDLSTRTPPNVKGALGAAELLPWATLGLSVRRKGGRELMELLRILPMSAREFLDEHLDDPALKGALALFSTFGAFLGPYGSGSTLNLINWFSGGFAPVFARGGAGALSAALAEAVRAAGGEIRLGTPVREILVENGRAAGVVTEDGERLQAAAVFSSADPRTTLSGLLPPGSLPVKFTRRLQNIRFKGSTATVHFALDRLPDFGLAPEHLDGWIAICPSTEYLERAYDDAKYRRISGRPALLIHIPSVSDPGMAEPGRHALTAAVRYAPYHLEHGSWDTLADLVAQTIAEYAPGFGSAVIDRRAITPREYESDYGLAEGAWLHGQMGLDQQLIMRPVPGWSDYRTPIPGLWLCGSGSHPGGGITCAPGHNAAREFLKTG